MPELEELEQDNYTGTYTPTTVPIFDNIPWTTLSPQINLTLSYTAYVDKDGRHRNRDMYSPNTYTFENLILTVTNESSGYFNGNIRARVFSGDDTTDIATLYVSPGYFKELTYNFGNLTVTGVTENVETINVKVQMYTNAPTTGQRSVQTHVGTGARFLTDLSKQILHDSGWRLGTSVAYWSQYNKNVFGIADKLLIDYYANQPGTFWDARWSFDSITRAIDGAYIVRQPGGQSLKFGLGQLNLSQQIMGKVSRYNDRMLSDLFIKIDKDTYGPQTYSIGDRNGIAGSIDVSAGKEYHLPEELELELSRYGKDFIYVSATPKDNYSPDPRWEYKVELREYGVTDPIYTDIVDDTGRFEQNYSGQFQSGMKESDESQELKIYPDKMYEVIAYYGDIDSEDPQPKVVSSKEIVVPTRYGFYVYVDDDLKWQWCKPFVYTENGWEECYPSMHNGSSWDTMDNIIPQTSQEEDNNE